MWISFVIQIILHQFSIADAMLDCTLVLSAAGKRSVDTAAR